MTLTQEDFEKQVQTPNEPLTEDQKRLHWLMVKANHLVAAINLHNKHQNDSTYKIVWKAKIELEKMIRVISFENPRI